MSTSAGAGQKVSVESLQNKYLGTGHPDTTKHEWATNQHRDTLASHIGHNDVLSFVAVAQGESKERARLGLIEKMIQPCGPPPHKSN